MNKHKSGGNDWASKVWVLVRGGNSAGAISQIKAAASLKDVQQLRKLMDAEIAKAKSSVAAPLSQVVDDQINALSHPRLHRSP
jgi:hypothetical protein